MKSKFLLLLCSGSLLDAVSDKLKPNYGAGFLLEAYHGEVADSGVRGQWNNLDCTLMRGLLEESCLQGLRNASSDSAWPGKGAVQRDENKSSEAKTKDSYSLSYSKGCETSLPQPTSESLETQREMRNTTIKATRSENFMCILLPKCNRMSLL